MTNRVLALPDRFLAAQNSFAAANVQKEPLVRGRRFAAVDANAHLILRAMVSPPCSEGPTVIKSPHGLSAGAPTLPRMG